MRDLKFRAWDGETKQMIDTGFHILGEVMAFGLIETWLYEHNPKKIGGLERLNDVVIMQSTGLKDKNGKEIYENDICKEEWEAPAGNQKSLYTIEFGQYMDGEGFPSLGFYKDYTLRKGKFMSGGNVYPVNDRWEVIGNIFENPELLN